MTIFFCDLSNNNWSSHQDVTNFLTAAKAEGISGAVHKVSQGSGFADPYWPTFRSWCESNDFPWLGYAYLDTSDPAAQAQQFVSNNGGSWAMLDAERGSGGIGHFWDVVNAFNQAGVSVSLAYDPAWYLGEIGDPDISNLRTNQISLVSSNYADGGTGSPMDIYNSLGADNGPGWQPYDGAIPTVWQFTESAIVAGRTVDCNAYRGTSLDALFTGNVF